MSSYRPAGKRGTPPIAFVAVMLALTLVLAFGMAALWAVDRIDTKELIEERQSIAAGLSARRQRIALDQDGSIVWDDAVINLRSDNQGWIAENLAEWMGEHFGHDRVYVLAPDNRLVRGAASGERIEAMVSSDVAPVLAMVDAVRQGLSNKAGGTGATSSNTGLGITETIRLADGQLAFISVRPILPTSADIRQAPEDTFLHVSVVLLGEVLLRELGAQYGLTDLHVGGAQRGQGSLPLLNNAGRVVGFVVWTPNKPALVLLQETAPATIGLLLIGVLSICGLLAWLRRTASKLAKSQAQIEYLAFHDPLTGAANRTLFEVQLQEALQYEYVAEVRVALVLIDLDKFKEVNDTLGHAAGDQLIKQAARRLLNVLPEGATLTRLGGDEFAVVHPGVVSDGHARFVCQSLLDTFHDPFLLAGEPVGVTASLGVAVEVGKSVSAAEMMRCADVALYAAKAVGRDCYRIYDPQMDQARRDKRTLEIDLRNALLTGSGLYLLYQPVFDARGSIAGAEALVRWEHPTRGHLTPDVFIGVAEEQKVIEQLGFWVLQEACRFAAGTSLNWIAVNVSPLQFENTRFADRVLDVLAQEKLAPERLELEITEGLLLQDSPKVQASLAKLRARGVTIALDDFGTGYSSISYLRHHSIDKLKIDRSFTQLVGRDKTTDTIVRSIVEMAQALNMTVTAEGVEDDIQRSNVIRLGCTTLQGYLMSRPVPGDRLRDMLEDGMTFRHYPRKPALP